MKIEGKGKGKDDMIKNFTTIWNDSQLGGSILNPSELIE